MNIRKNKIYPIIIMLIVVCGLFITLGNIQAKSINKCYISALKIKSSSDGLEPFDSNNEPGNDSSPNNKIIRSFDNVNYTLEYVTTLKTQEIVDEAYLFFEFKLPYDKNIAQFNMDAMAWVVDPQLKVENGVQILTGKRYLKNTADTNAIPGTGTLSVGIKLAAAPNNTKITPSFKLWIEGNSETEKQNITADTLTVSAAPKYNILVNRNYGTDFLSYYNFNTGKISPVQDGESQYGRLEGYGLAVQLKNDSAAKGLKGIEFPTGDLTFDITIKSEVNNVDKTFDPTYKIQFWDYTENEYTTTGKLGRVMVPRGASLYSRYVPLNTGNSDYACYDGGKIQMVQDPSRKNVYHCTIKDYKFDYENYNFPIRYPWTNGIDINYGPNEGCFSTANIVLLSALPEKVSDVNTVYQELKVSNLKVKSVSGADGYEVSTNDNTTRVNITLYPEGGITKYTRITTRKDPGTFLSSTYYEGDNASYHNSDLYIYGFGHGRGEYRFTAFNLLQKFDDECFDIISDDYLITGFQYEGGTHRGLWAAKPDKTGWINDDEMEEAMEEDLIYFENIADLKNAGYTCVGFLAEVRDIKTNQLGAEQTYFDMFIPVHIKDSSKIGSVYQSVSEIRAWRENYGDMNFSWTHMPKNTNEKSFGSGAGGSYVNGYTAPYANSYTIHNRYEKTRYENGTVYGHKGGYQAGNSLLIMGYESKLDMQITNTVIDSSGHSITKTAFDMDNNERVVGYSITPRTVINSPNGGDPSDGSQNKYTDLKVQVNVPKDLKYNPGSSINEPQIINNEDGSQTLIWNLKHCRVGDTLPPIKFNCTIGKAGTNKDVENNQQIKLSAQISGTEDLRKVSLANGNLSEKSFVIIKLNAISIFKASTTPYIPLNQEFNYTLQFANNSQNNINNAKLYDVLPYNGDVRGSKFHGDFKINSISIDFSGAPKTFADLSSNPFIVKYTTNDSIKTDDFNVISNFSDWHEFASVNTANKTITISNCPQNIRGLLFGTYLFGFENIKITMNMSGISKNGEAPQEGDVYINDFYQYSDSQVKQVHSNKAVVQVYGHLDLTKLWIDENNKYGTRPESIRIKIKQNGDEYKIVTLNSSNASSNDPSEWNLSVPNVILYDYRGKPYNYTIEELDLDTFSKYYMPPTYNQKLLLVENEGAWVYQDNYPECNLEISKIILNNENKVAIKSDFDKIRLPANGHTFNIVLKKMNTVLSKGKDGMVENYSGYSPVEIHGVLTQDEKLVFNGITPGKYEIVELDEQYFKLFSMDEISSNHAVFSKEGNKYFVTFPLLERVDKDASVNINNKIDNERPYDQTEEKQNLLNP